MKYLEITINCLRDDIEIISSQLMDFGIFDVQIDDPAEIEELIDSLGETEWYDREQVNPEWTIQSSDAVNLSLPQEKLKYSNLNNTPINKATITFYLNDDEEGRKKLEEINTCFWEFQNPVNDYNHCSKKYNNYSGDVSNISVGETNFADSCRGNFSTSIGDNQDKFHESEFCSGSITISSTVRDDSEWKDAWKEFFVPTVVSDGIKLKDGTSRGGIIVAPTWASQEATDLLINNINNSNQMKSNQSESEEEAEAASGCCTPSKSYCENPIVIRLDPGMAFGTGTHETTALSLRLLEKYIRPVQRGENGGKASNCNENRSEGNSSAEHDAWLQGPRVLDVGTGSGILAIAAAKLGASEILAIDIDEDAVQVAKENIQGNGLIVLDDSEFDTWSSNEEKEESSSKSEKNTKERKRRKPQIKVSVGDLTKGVDFVADIVVANLLADLIIRFAPDAAKHLAPGGLFIASGILTEKLDIVSSAIESAGLEIIDTMAAGEWTALTAKKR